MPNYAFLPETIILPVNELYPMFTRPVQVKKRNFYRTIISSIREIGLIEPLVVVNKEGRYFIKDGYLRWQALKELGIEKVECLVGTDMDVYTYNKRVNALAPIQAQAMVEKAVKNGVDPDKIAAALNVSRDWVNRMENLLVGISPAVVDKLKHRVVTKTFFEELKKVLPERQIEILQIVEAADDYSPKYVRALVFATPPHQRANTVKKTRKLDSQAQVEMAGKLRAVETEFRKASETFRDNIFNLVKLSGYIRKLIGNAVVHDFLNRQYPDVLVEFEKIANDSSLNV